MAKEQASPSGPDLTQGVALSDLVDGRLGRSGGELASLKGVEAVLSFLGLKLVNPP